MSNPGKLDRRVTFQRRVLTTLPSGQKSVTFTCLFTRWCSVREERGTEGQLPSARAATRRIGFYLRYTDQIDETCRAVYKGRNWDITNVREATEGPRLAYMWVDAQSVSEGERG